MPNSKLRPGRPARGYVIIGVLLVVAALIVNLDAVRDVFRDHVEVVALVSEAPAVRVGSPVLLEGVPVGRVTRIAFRGAGDSAVIALRLRLEGRARALLRSDSRARTTRQRFLGQPIVVLDAGSDSAAAIEDGDTLRERAIASLDDLFDRGRRLSGAIDSLLADTGAMQDVWNARAPQIRRLSRSIATLSDEATTLSAALRDGPVERALGPGGALDRLGALRRRSAELADALAATRDRYAPGPGSPLGDSLESVRGRAAALDGQIGRLQARIDASPGFLPRMQRDSALLLAVARLRAQVDSVVADAGSLALRMFLP